VNCGVDGLAVLGGAQATLEGCYASKNGANGLYVRGDGSHVLVSGCRMVGNGWQV
jgi:parallel beta-helix repeat protein